MNADKQAIIEKLQKILSKADSSRNPSQAEVETAMRLAQKIAVENNLNLAAIMSAKAPEDKSPTIETTKMDGGYRASRQQIEHEYIFRVIIECFDVQVVRLGKTGFVIIGETMDTSIASFCFTFLESMFSKLMRQYARSRGARNYGPVIMQSSYYRGLELGIIEANKRVKQEAAQSQSYALVLVDKAALVKQRMAQEFPNLRYTKAKERPTDYCAERAGIEKGRTIKLQHQLS